MKPLDSLLLLAHLAIAIALSSTGCGSGGSGATRSLPGNIMARPNGIVGVVTVGAISSLPTALRALGVPFEQISTEGFGKRDLTRYKTIVIDEFAFDEESLGPIYRRIMLEVKYGRTLIILRQQEKRLPVVTGPVRRITAREIDFGVRLTTVRRTDPMLTSPNAITRENLDSLAREARQLASGGPTSRAIISSTTSEADRAALLLWEPYEDGAVWYLAIPIVARAAAGLEAEQKLLANLLSNK